MRINAIQTYGAGNFKVQTRKQKSYSQTVNNPQETPKADSVSFSGKKMLKGTGIGALLGIAAITLISGGAATPAALAVFGSVMGAAGGSVGNALDKIDEKNKKDKND